MTDNQKRKLFELLVAYQDTAVEYGAMSERWDSGEYIPEETWRAKGDALHDAMQDILNYLETI